jgi:hypothetical protein
MTMSRHHRRRWLGAAVTVGVLISILGPGATGVLAKPPAHCLTPTGVDLNERYGVSDAIVAPFCTEIAAGHRWTVTNAWFMNTFFESTPPGFVPAGATPAEDYAAKFEAVKYVVDPGSKKERTVVFTNVEDLAIVSADPQVVANPITLGSLSPLSPGTHNVDSYLVFSALHCDGRGGGGPERWTKGMEHPLSVRRHRRMPAPAAMSATPSLVPRIRRTSQWPR